MKRLIIILCLGFYSTAFAIDPNHFTLTRISAPYFIVDGNQPSAVTKAYVGFEVKNNSNSNTTYSNLKFTITSINTSVTGQDYSLISPVSGIINAGTLAPGETKVCYYYISYPAHSTAQATFNVQLSDHTASNKTQSFVIYNRSSISANAGGTATQTFTNQDLIGGLVYDDVTYVVGNVQNGDENDFQVAVSSQFDPTKISLLSTAVTASSVPGIPVGATDSLYFITGNGSNGATITIRWTFRIAATNFTTYLLPCAGATSGATNYKYALNTALGSGTPITVSSGANPLTISKTSDQLWYTINAPAIFTITITNPGAYGITIDKITDELPSGFTFQSMHATSQITTTNSTSTPANGATGLITFEGGVSSSGNTSYYIPAGGTLILKYNTTSSPSTALNLVTTARDYVGSTEVGSAQNTVNVSATLPVSLVSLSAVWVNDKVKINWETVQEINSYGYEIEKSNNSNEFNKIGTVYAIGSSASYSFIDSFPAIGRTIYRLKMIDRDNQISYSSAVLLQKKMKGLVIQNCFPNPFLNDFNIQIFSDHAQNLELVLTDISGKTVYTRTYTCHAGMNHLQFDKTSKLKSGIYFLRIGSVTDRGLHKLLKLQ